MKTGVAKSTISGKGLKASSLLTRSVTPLRGSQPLSTEGALRKVALLPDEFGAEFTLTQNHDQLSPGVQSTPGTLDVVEAFAVDELEVSGKGLVASSLLTRSVTPLWGSQPLSTEGALREATLSPDEFGQISEKNEQKNMKMETYMNRRIDEYIVGFKNDIKSKMSTLEIINQSNSSETEREKMREFLEFIFEYPKLVLDKKDFIVSKRRSSSIHPDQETQVNVLTFPVHMQCLAKRSDGIQCTRKKKKCCDFCGTHAKLDAIQRTSTPESIQRMEVSAEDIHGIIYYIDRFNNVYNTEDILESKENPRIIAKATKHSNNMYMIEEFL